MTEQEIQQLSFLIEKAKTTLTTPKGDKPEFVYTQGKELKGISCFTCSGGEDLFSINKDGVVEKVSRAIY